MLAHADETDDSHAPSLTHPGCGTYENPMTREEVDEKCFPLLAPVLGKQRARRLIDTVWRLERVSNVRC
jgi:hypothetical protein